MDSPLTKPPNGPTLTFFDEEEASVWRDAGFKPEEAQAWSDVAYRSRRGTWPGG